MSRASRPLSAVIPIDKSANDRFGINAFKGLHVSLVLHVLICDTRDTWRELINELTSSEWLLILAEVAIEAYTEVIETVRDITGFADRVAGHVDDNVGAARAEDTHSTFDVGVGGVVLPTHDGVVEGGDVGVEVLVADGDGDVNVINGEERVGVVCQLASDVVEVIVLGEGNAGQEDGIAGIFDSGAGDGEMERVAQFLVVECDERLV